VNGTPKRITSPPAHAARASSRHRWTFSQSLADVSPEDWGGTSAAGR
jgi:hypothetical protein